jgi:catechol 2,3-dioxygenase-like lactoylglutathione lyase family enzyme
MRFLLCFVAALCFAPQCFAQLPAYYSRVDHVTWLTQNIDAILPSWIALGLSDVHRYANLREVGTDHGKPVTLYTWQVTGRLGNLPIQFVQPDESQSDALNDFLNKHKDGIFSVVHRVPSQEAMNAEIHRMAGLGVSVLQQVTLTVDHVPVSYTYFDTEPRGKYVLGLVYSPRQKPQTTADPATHLGLAVRDLPEVRAYWQRLGFPGFAIEQAAPRGKAWYRGQPLSLSFTAGVEMLRTSSYEWIEPPAAPRNIYQDFLERHGEGVQHIGLAVKDLGKARQPYQKLGLKVWQSGAWGQVGQPFSAHSESMDTDSLGGVSVELMHAH